MAMRNAHGAVTVSEKSNCGGKECEDAFGVAGYNPEYGMDTVHWTVKKRKVARDKRHAAMETCYED
jgi:hypothetical protein